MEYRRLGNSGCLVSSCALGTMTFGAEADEAESRRILDTFVDWGGTLVDVADVYVGGVSEQIVGRWWKALDASRRDSVVLATKGRFPLGVEPRDAGLSRRHLRRALEGSLTRMGVDHVDLYQMHSWDPLTPIEETVAFLADAVSSGKVGYVGVSNFTGWQIAAFAATAHGRVPFVSVQPQYSLLVRQTEWEIVPAAEHAGVGLLPWSPLGGGWLTGKYRRDVRPDGPTRLGEQPDRGSEAYDRRSGHQRTWTVLDAVAHIADARGVTMAQVAVAWLLARPGVTSVILGARGASQLADNLGATNLSLDPGEMAQLDAASDPEPADYPYGGPGIEQRSRPTT